MPKARISRSSVDKLEAVPGKQIPYFDTRITGFGVKVNGASRTYFVQVRIKGRKNSRGNNLEVYESLGRTDVVDFDKALSRAKEIIEDAAHGIAPADRQAERENLESDKRAKAKIEGKRDVTVSDIFKEYVPVRKTLKVSTVDTYKRDLERYLGDWLDLPLRSIDGNMVVAKHAEIGKKSKARADGVMRVLRALFNHAMHMYDDVIFKNPVSKLSAVNAWYKVPRRESYVKPADLKAWLPAVLNLGFDTTQDFILVMLFQGSRVTETSTLQWKDVNLTDATATFRETKTGVVLEVPLSRYIVGRLAKRKEFYYAGPESFIFPSYGASGHVTDARSALEVIRLATGVKASHHDLRRSFISYCEELEVSLFSRKKLVNHAIPLDVTEGYTFFNMAKLRETIELVAAFILDHAGIPYEQPKLPVLTEQQAAAVADTEFWATLSEAQKEAFVDILAPKKEIADNVVDIQTAKIRRRMTA